MLFNTYERQDLFLLYKLNHLLIERSLCKPYERILIAISGGQDSICLLALLKRLSVNWNWILGIVHCDHKWSSNSVLQSKHVSKLAFNLKINYYEAISTQNVNTEEDARKWRYELMRRIAICHQYTMIVTGHTASDRVETFFLHLTRGSGTNVFHSLSWKRKLNTILITSFYSNYKYVFIDKFIYYQEYQMQIQLKKASQRVDIIRPFLFLTRTETTNLLQKWNLYLHLDQTNKYMIIQRNRVRYQLLPYLRKYLNPKIDYLLNNWIEIVYAETIYLENLIEHLILKIAHSEKQSISPKYNKLNVLLLRALPFTLQRRILKRFVYINIQKNINFDHIEQIRLAYARNIESSKRFQKNNKTVNINNDVKRFINLPGKTILQIEKDILFIFKYSI